MAIKLNIRHLLEGIGNTVFVTEVVETIAAGRMEKCNACPRNSVNAKAAGTYKSMRVDDHCTACACNLKWKTHSLSSACPLDPPLWEAVDGVSADESKQIDEVTGNTH